MATNSLLSTIVLELLRKDNYANWSAWMENYLLAQDLWDIVKVTIEPPRPEGDAVEFKAWRKNNAAALHAILISCGVDILPEIREIRSAKIVWDKLAAIYGLGNSSNILADSSSNNPGSLGGAGSINNDLLQYEPLRTAINRGDWVAANNFLSSHEDAKNARISNDGGTVLHLAVFAGHTEIVEKLVELMSAEGLEKRDNDGLTALAQWAVILRNTRMVECMLRKNTNLLNIPDNSNNIPLITALEYGNIKVAQYLYSLWPPSQTLSDIDGSTALTHFILLNNFDAALHLLRRCPRAAIVPNKYDSSPLVALASKSSTFPSGNQLVFWKNWIYDRIPIRLAHCTNEIQIEIHNPNEQQSDQSACVIAGFLFHFAVLVLLRLRASIEDLWGIKKIYEMKLLHHQAHQLLLQMCSQVKQMNGDYVRGAIFEAVKRGTVEFIDQIIKVDRQLLYTTDTLGRNVLFYAVLHRQTKIFRLIYGLDEKNLIVNALDNSGSTILHMAGMLEPSIKRDRIAGEALKLQSELQWFKEVEEICPPNVKENRNDAGMTARELFIHTHKDMMKEGEKWMKDTATSCTVIGTLIVTIMFPAAFTVPGGNNQTTGLPIFLDKKLFIGFLVSVALSLLSSALSVLVFLDILTSSCTEEDFLEYLPREMIKGLSFLSFSIATMMIAFLSGLLLMLSSQYWIVIALIYPAVLIVSQLSLTQFPRLFHMFTSTYGLYLKREMSKYRLVMFYRNIKRFF